MTGRVAAVRNRLVVAIGAVLLAWLFGWTSDEGLLMLLVAVVALALALMRGIFGGLYVLGHWMFRYRMMDIGLRELDDIIGEHKDDMRRAGLVVSQQRPQRIWRRRHAQMRRRPLPDLLPTLRHEPYDGGIVVRLEAVRAGMSQEEILRALPRLRSAWGVDVIDAVAKPGGRVVEIRIPFTDQARADLRRDDDDVPRRRREPAPVAATQTAERPPDGPPVQVVQGAETSAPISDGGSRRTRPPTIRPRLQPDERGHYELEMLPLDAARTFSPRPLEDTSALRRQRAEPQEIVVVEDIGREPATDEPPVRTDEMPVIEPGARTSTPVRRPPVVTPEFSADDGRRNPTDIDERELRIGPHWRTGKER